MGDRTHFVSCGAGFLANFRSRVNETTGRIVAVCEWGDNLESY